MIPYQPKNAIMEAILNAAGPAGDQVPPKGSHFAEAVHQAPPEVDLLPFKATFLATKV